MTQLTSDQQRSFAAISPQQQQVGCGRTCTVAKRSSHYDARPNQVHGCACVQVGVHLGICAAIRGVEEHAADRELVQCLASM